MAARVTQLSVEAFIAPTGAARVSQIAVEAFLAIGLISGSAGIASGEAFGVTDGAVTTDSGTTLTGTAGIASAEAFGSTGGTVAGPVTGPAGIASAESFGSTGAIVAGLVRGEDGIISREAFGAGGYVNGPINGQAGIASGEAFGSTGASVAGPITGAAGIASAEAFGTIASVVGPVTGTAGIPSAAAFGSGGDVRQVITGAAGIVSAEAFGAGEVRSVIQGYFGIASAEAFGRSGTVIGSRDFTLFINGYDWTPLLQADSLNWRYEWGGRGSSTFQLQDGTNEVSAVWRPPAQAEVIFYVGTQRAFAGFLQAFTEECLPSSKAARFDCECTDYTVICDWRFFARTYTGPTFDLATIVQDIFDATLSAEGVSYEAEETATVTGSRIVFEDESVAQCFDRLSAIFGFDWWVDAYRRLRFVRTAYIAAPHVVRDNNGVIDSMRVRRTDEAYRNRQGARTAIPVAGQRNVTLAGAGAWTYTLPFAVSGKPRVVVNSTAATVVEYSQRHLSAWDFAYQENKATLWHNPTQAAYTSSDTIVVTARSQNLDVFWYDASDEQALRAARTGGSGIVEAVIPARNIRDQGVAASFALQMIKRLGSMRQEVDLVTRTTGWFCGQQVSVATQWPLAAGLLMVQSLQGQYLGNTYVRYSLKMVGFEPPLIKGLEFDAEDETINIETLIPHGLGPGDPIELWGINDPDGSGINWPGWTVGSAPTETTLVLPIDGSPFEPVNWPGYTGGAGGPNEGHPLLPGVSIPEFPTGGPEPGGGFITTGGPAGTGGGFVPGNGSGSGGLGDPGLIVIAVNASTREVQTHRDHNFTTGYPSWTAGTRVRIVGVSGASSQLSSINTELSRITVTDTDKFIVEDKSVISSEPGFEAFVDDRRGRVYTTDQSLRVTPGTGPGSWISNLGAAAGGTGSTNNVDRATFVLANSIPGVASRPLQVTSGGSATSPWVYQGDIGVVESVSAVIGTPSAGAPVLIDVKKNGASIFSASQYLEIPAGATEVVRTIDFSSTPTTIERDDQLTVDVVQVGTEFAGCNCVVNVAFRR